MLVRRQKCFASSGFHLINTNNPNKSDAHIFGCGAGDDLNKP